MRQGFWRDSSSYQRAWPFLKMKGKPVKPQDIQIKNKTILTGDRPTGPLHLGHLAGTLLARVDLQRENDQTILVADLQALTDNAKAPGRLAGNVLEVMLDYLAVGINPEQSNFALQSAIPELAELSMLYMNLVSTAQLERNPTIRSEIQGRGFGASVPAGFLCYPVSQAADITGFGADLVPAGADQEPIVELTNLVVDRVNRLAGQGPAPLVRATLFRSHAPRLPGVDGAGKMSKSAGNAISLSDSADEIRAKVRAMFTDPDHLQVSDPGKVEGNVVFAMLDAFDPDQAALVDLKAQYRRGGLGDMVLKRRLEGILQELIAPISARRAELARDPGEVLGVLDQGTRRARARVAQTLSGVRRCFGLT